MELGKKGLFFLVQMPVFGREVHDLLIFAGRDLKVADGVVNELFQTCCGFAWLSPSMSSRMFSCD